MCPHGFSSTVCLAHWPTHWRLYSLLLSSTTGSWQSTHTPLHTTPEEGQLSLLFTVLIASLSDIVCSDDIKALSQIELCNPCSFLYLAVLVLTCSFLCLRHTVFYLCLSAVAVLVRPTAMVLSVPLVICQLYWRQRDLKMILQCCVAIGYEYCTNLRQLGYLFPYVVFLRWYGH